MLLILIACVLGIWVWKMIFTTNVSYDNLTRITHIKEMIRLNTFEMVNEFVYKDTLDDIGVVYNIKSRITIGFDLDSLKYRETDGVLEVELPPATSSTFIPWIADYWTVTIPDLQETCSVHRM